MERLARCKSTDDTIGEEICEAAIIGLRWNKNSSLEEWFADSVNQKGESFQFKWDDEERKAKLLSSKKNQFIRWQWDESEYANTFFEMRIKIDEMTNEVALIITDFCESGDEEDARMLWDLAIDDLHRVIGR